MSGYLRRLASTGAAYTAASIISKVIAVALLPVYTRFLSPSDYGAAEVMFAGVVAASIVVRLGSIEALMRFYYQGGERPAEVVRTSFAILFWSATVGALVLLPFAGPISEGLLDHSDPGLARVAIGGLWTLTLFEYLLTIFRLQERARPFFVVTVANVLVTIPVTLVLVTVADMGAMALLIGSYASGACFVLGLIAYHRRRLALIPDVGLARRLFRFGLPTMPAELSLYSLNFIDRIIIVRSLGLAEAGLYSIAVKVAQGVNVLVRGFQLAWPPLAYSIADDAEARRAYSAVVTWFTAGMCFLVTGAWLMSPWIVRVFAAPDFYEAHDAVGLVCAGAALYAVYMVLLVVLGRTGRTEFNFPATVVGMGANVALNLVMVPAWGIVGAGIALSLSYLVVLVLMYAFTQRLFPVPYEWGRIARSVLITAGLIAIGTALTSADDAVGFVIRALLVCAMPALLYLSGFLRPGERDAIARLSRPGALAARIRSARASRADTARADAARPDAEPSLPESVEVETMDEDFRG